MSKPDDIFSIPGADGVPVRGDVYVPARMPSPPLVVLVHGFKGFKDWGFLPWLGRTLADSGLAVAAINLSHCGIMEGYDHFDRLDLFEADTWGRRMHDLQQVLNAASAGKLPGNAGRLGLLGHSMGGGLALLTAARDGRVRSLCTLAGVASARRIDGPEVREQLRSFGDYKVLNARTRQEMRLGKGYFDELDADPAAFDLAGAARRMVLPWLLVHGADDESVPLSDAHELLDWSAENPIEGENVKLLTLDGTGHTFGARHPFAGPTVHLEQMAAAVSAHFLRTL